MLVRTTYREAPENTVTATSPATTNHTPTKAQRIAGLSLRPWRKTTAASAATARAMSAMTQFAAGSTVNRMGARF